MTIKDKNEQTFLMWPTLDGVTVRLTTSTGEYREVRLDRTQLNMIREFISDMEVLRKEMDIVSGCDQRKEGEDVKIPPGDLFNTYADVGEVFTVGCLDWTNNVTVTSTTNGKITGVMFHHPLRRAERARTITIHREMLRHIFLRVARSRHSIPSMNYCIVAWRHGASYIHDDSACIWCGKRAALSTPSAQ